MSQNRAPRCFIRVVASPASASLSILAMAVIGAGRARAVTRDTGFETLFRTEYPRVVAVAARILLDEAAAEDVAQDVFLAFHRSQDPAAPHAPGWLRAAAAHAALNQLRSQRRRAARELKVTAAPVAMDPADRVGIA